ncbi:hypothetical protein C7S18_23750 (plasmid) [Ahniella affigens]|uniref:Uncharacterized protein n=1 Tax=Ahniella affigens TaxID=2021234 RepID=A0A2P1PZS7_9GAMM|nr:hypothetical protein C7S18_23750 [Ahniella affigens]
MAGIEWGVDLSHLAPACHVYELKLQDGIVHLPFRVRYSPHCWTRTKSATDSDDQFVWHERRSDGQVEARVICPIRYSFSAQLPGIVASLQNASVYRGRGEVFYRTKDTDRQRGLWAVCLKFDVNVGAKELRLTCKSAHHRHNLPHDAKQPADRFFRVLRTFYLSHAERHDWIPRPTKEKGP